MRPVDVTTEQTLQFVNANVPLRKLRMLEIGCGAGELALNLQKLGHEVIAIDSSASSVDVARCLGVDARVSRFPDFEDAPFDCVLFTRSLHHISPVSAAVEKAAHLLKPSGLLIVEDFAFSDVHEHTADWFYALLTLLDVCGVLLPAEGTFGRQLLAGSGAFSLWRDHTHTINSAQAVLQSRTARFDVLEVKSVPYLYRYIAQMVAEDDCGGMVVAQSLKLEKKTYVEDERFLMGRRFVARQMKR